MDVEKGGEGEGGMWGWRDVGETDVGVEEWMGWNDVWGGVMWMWRNVWVERWGVERCGSGGTGCEGCMGWRNVGVGMLEWRDVGADWVWQ